MYYGYDIKEKYLFSWDGDFRFEGKTDSPPIEATKPVDNNGNRSVSELAGCLFLSGSYRGYFFRVESLDKEVFGLIAPGHRMLVHGQWNTIPGMKELLLNPSAPVCLCGPVVRNPASVAEFCREFSSRSVYVCPLVDELAAFGVLVSQLVLSHKEKPRRASLCVPNAEPMPGDFVEFDSKLEGDGLGRMAHLVGHGTPVLNDMMRCPGISPFYGKVLTAFDGSHFIVRSDSVQRYFPHEPISAKMYAATSVPVEVKNTDQFREKTGCMTDKVAIVVTSDYIPNLPVFMNFYKVITGRDFVGVMNPENCPKNVPVFRYNRGYRGACDA